MQKETTQVEDEQIPRIALSVTDRSELRRKGQIEYVEKKLRGVKSTLEIGVNSHQSEKTGKVSGFKITVPHSTLASLVIQCDDFPAARALYLLDIPEGQLADYKKRVSDTLENLKEDTRVYDPSICFDINYHTQRPKEAIIFLGDFGVSIGLYWFKQEVSEEKSRVMLVFVIQSSYCSTDLKNFVRSSEAGLETQSNFDHSCSDVRGIRQVYSSSAYQKSLEQGNEYRNLLAGLLHQSGCGISPDTPIVPLTPSVLNPFNVIDTDETGESCVFFDHAFPVTAVESGVILGHGPANGFWWLHSKEKQTPFCLKPDSKFSSFPMGTRRMATVFSGVSHARKGDVVCWGTIGPNPYCDKSIFEELAFSGEFYKKLGDAGLDFATTEVAQLKPVKVYISTPLQLNPRKHYSGKHTSLKHWIKYPLDPHQKTMFIPLDHPFLLQKFMPLYNQLTDKVGIKLCNILIAEDAGGVPYQGIFLNKPAILTLLRASSDHKELLETC